MLRDQFPDFRNELHGNIHYGFRHLRAGFVFRNSFFFSLSLVMCQDASRTRFVPAGWKFAHSLYA